QKAGFNLVFYTPKGSLLLSCAICLVAGKVNLRSNFLYVARGDSSCAISHALPCDLQRGIKCLIAFPDATSKRRGLSLGKLVLGLDQ
ncbi:MAG: hypothetical protein RSB68_03905, partial [Raoultibacter sp.]